MKDEYDFSKGQRGEFYQPGAVFKLPVYLDEDEQSYLAAKAESKGVELSEFVTSCSRKRSRSSRR